MGYAGVHEWRSSAMDTGANRPPKNKSGRLCEQAGRQPAHGFQVDAGRQTFHAVLRGHGPDGRDGSRRRIPGLPAINGATLHRHRAGTDSGVG